MKGTTSNVVTVLRFSGVSFLTLSISALKRSVFFTKSFMVLFFTQHFDYAYPILDTILHAYIAHQFISCIPRSRMSFHNKVKTYNVLFSRFFVLICLHSQFKSLSKLTYSTRSGTIMIINALFDFVISHTYL